MVDRAGFESATFRTLELVCGVPCPFGRCNYPYTRRYRDLEEKGVGGVWRRKILKSTEGKFE